jgi:WD40 repeat protein
MMVDVDEGKVMKRIPTGMDLVNDVAFSPDGGLIAVSGGYPQQWGGVLFLDAASGAERGLRKVAADTLFRGEFSPDGSEVAFGGPGGVVHVIPVDSAKPVRAMEIHSDWVMDVAYTPDGKRLVSGSRDKTTKVSSVEEMALLRSVDESNEMIYAVATDGDTGVSGGSAKVLAGYDYKLALAGVEVTGSGNGATPVNKKAQYLRAFEGQTEAVMTLATSGDRKLLVVGTRASDIRVYRFADRGRLVVLPKAEAPVLGVAMDEAGSRVLSGSKSGKVQIWDVKEGKLLHTLNPVPVK